MHLSIRKTKKFISVKEKTLGKTSWSSEQSDNPGPPSTSAQYLTFKCSVLGEQDDGRRSNILWNMFHPHHPIVPLCFPYRQKRGIDTSREVESVSSCVLGTRLNWNMWQSHAVHSTFFGYLLWSFCLLCTLHHKRTVYQHSIVKNTCCPSRMLPSSCLGILTKPINKKILQTSINTWLYGQEQLQLHPTMMRRSNWVSLRTCLYGGAGYWTSPKPRSWFWILSGSNRGTPDPWRSTGHL